MNFSKEYNRQEFLSFLKHSFLPEDFLDEGAEIKLQTTTTYTQSVTKLGTCNSLDLVVYEIKHSSENDARVSLSKEAFRILSDEFQSKALVIFIPDNNATYYRFSLITIELDINDKGKLVREYSNPRRYSYLLGKDIPSHTPNKYLLQKGRVNDNTDLIDRFSVEVLTKVFYQELYTWYTNAINNVKSLENMRCLIMKRL